MDEQYSGKIATWNYALQIAQYALLLDPVPEDVYVLTDEQLAQVKDILVAQRPHVRKYWDTGFELAELMLNGEVVIADGWTWITHQIQAEGGSVQESLPSEGVTGWSDSWVISKEAQNYDLAMKWADWMIGVEGQVGLNGWIKIASDGGVLLAMNRSEMGQGVHTALAMLAAEELDVPLGLIRLIEAGHESLYGNVAVLVASLPLHPSSSEPGHETAGVRAARWIVGKVARELGLNLTGGSSSVADAWDVLRLAAATARAQLVGAASLRWKQPADELLVRDGVVLHPPSGHSAHYGELAREAAATPSGTVRLKERERWRLIGKAAPRIDLPAKTDGSARFGIDVRRPGQVYAVVRHAPMLGGSPGTVNVEPAMKLAGVGLGLGLPLAFALSSAMSSLLFGVVSLDFSTFALFTAVLASVALVSSYIPARAATRVDPMIALRVE